MILRRAKPDDAAAISRLILSFLKEFTVDPNGIGAEKLCGFIAMQGKTHVFHLFVAPQYQRQGLARALWQTARDAAGQPNDVREFTVNSSLLAVPVYERFGFERASEPVERNGISFIRMRHVVASAQWTS